jgi:tetratricopeptide (TPR) repeat protein
MGRAADYHTTRGTDLLARYRATGSQADLLAAVDAFRRVVMLNPARSQDAPAGRFLLCIALRELYDATGDVAALREAVEVGTAAAQAMPADRPSYATGALNLAIALRDLGQRTGDPDLVEGAIGYGRWGVGSLGPGHPLRPDAFCDLAAALHVRYELTGDLDALREAIAAGWQALEIIPEGHPLRVPAPYNLARRLDELYRKTGEPRALDDAIAIARWGVQISAGDAHHADHLRLLADLLRAVYRDRGDVDALREAVSVLQNAASRLPRERRNAGVILIGLGAALESLGRETGDSDATRGSVHWLRHALALSGDDAALSSAAAYNLMLGLSSLHNQTGQADLLPEAARFGRQALQGTPEPGATRGERAGRLAILLLDLAEASGGDEALRAEAVGLLREAVRTAEGETLQLSRVALWRELRAGYNKDGGLPQLQEAVEQIRAALAATDPHDDLYAEFQHSLGTSLLALYMQTTDARTLDEAVRQLREAVAAASAGDPDSYRQRRASLAVTLLSVFERDRAEPALDEAIAILWSVTDARGDAPSPVDVSNLVHALLLKFELTGRLADLEQAIDLGRRAAGLASDDPTVLSNLAISLTALYQRTRQSNAAGEALSLLRRAAAAVPPGHPNAAAVFSNISITMSGLAQRLGEAALRDEAIGFARKGADAAPPGHHGRSAALNALGSQLTDRFPRTGQAADLRDAIAVLEEAVNTPGRAARAVARYNLARATGRLGLAAGDVGLLREAVALARQALGEVDAPAGRARISGELGLQLYRLMASSGDRSLEPEILAACAAAVAEEQAPADLRLEAARSRAEVLAEAGRWPESLADYATAIDLVGQVAARHLPSGDKQHELAAIASLGTDAAACAINAGDPRRAVELAEHARGVLLAEAFDAQADVTELRRRAPGLADRFESLRDELDAAGLTAPPAVTAGYGETEIITLASPAELQHRTGQRWNDLLRDIRLLPGFETFLKPPPFRTLASAAAEGPVVLLNVSRFRSDALVLRHRDDGSAGVQVIPLPGVDPQTVAGYAVAVMSQSGDGFAVPEAGPKTAQDVREWLWDAVVEPVLAGQGLLPAGPPARLPRIWWCPTGFLSYLPLHAAGLPGAGPERPDSALDRVVSSYTPSIRALVRERRGSRNGRVTAVIVAVPAAPGVDELPAVAAEARQVAGNCPGALLLEGPQACHEEVVRALAGHSLAHFACHAISFDGDPSASRLVLYDYATAPLSVSGIMRCETQAAELAFLSACSTARTSPRLVDEALHITSAFHIAGFPEVIGTLWPVADRAAAEIARDFYASYLPDGTGLPRVPAAYALHEAIRQARDRYRYDPLLWAAHVHVGR